MGKTMLHKIDVIPSPQTSETESETAVALVRVITRARAIEEKQNLGKEGHNSEVKKVENSKMKTKRCKQRSKRSKKSKEKSGP